MKPNQQFKLKRSTKTLLSTFVDPHARGHFKRMMIDAQLSAAKREKDKE